MDDLYAERLALQRVIVGHWAKVMHKLVWQFGLAAALINMAE